MRALLPSLCVLLCACGDARAHGHWESSSDASVRIPAEASVGGGFGSFPPMDAGCVDCPPVADGGTCPATWAEATAGDGGIVECPATECGYPEGTCVCLRGCGIGQIRALGDSWFCTPATPECPSPRPRSGTSCGDAGPVCHYGPVCCDGAWTMFCSSGAWEAFPEMVCP